MTEKNDNEIMILFLKSFKEELIALAETLKAKVLKQNELDNVLAFKIASDEEKAVIHEMVSDIANVKGAELETGQDNSVPNINADRLSEESNGNDLGKSKTYATSHFHNDKEAA